MPLLPKTQAFFDEIKKNGGAPLQVNRENIEQFRKDCTINCQQLASPLPSDVNPATDLTDLIVDLESQHQVRFQCYVPKDLDADAELPTIIYLHGGGFCLSLNIHQPAAITMAKAAGCKIMMMDYPLAPEHTAKEIIDITYKAVKYLYQHHTKYKIDTTNFIIAGCSSGATIAAVVSNLSSNDPDLNISMQVLLTPLVDLSLETHKNNPFLEYQKVDVLCTPEANEIFVGIYVPNETERKLPYVSPLYHGNWANLPKTLIVTGEYDGLRADGEYYAKVLAKADVDVTLKVLAGQTHCFAVYREVLNEADDEDPSEIAGISIRENIDLKLTNTNVMSQPR